MSSSRKTASATPGPGAAAHKPSAGPAGRRNHPPHATLRFLLRFCALVALVELLCGVGVVKDRGFPACLRLDARAAAASLRWMGYETTARDVQVVSPRTVIELRRGCDAIEPSAVLAAGIIAFPSRWRWKGLGLLLGTLALMLLNLVRIDTLFLARLYFPSAFNTLHVDVWPVVVVFVAMGLWGLWMMGATWPRPVAP